MMTPFGRRAFATMVGSLAIAGPAIARRSPREEGSRLYDDVVHYAGLGDHRTASPADNATTSWLGDRLGAAGYKIDTPGFVLDTFEPERCQLSVGDTAIAAFPAWPAVPTSGTMGRLHDAREAGSLTGRIALVVLPYRPGAAFIVPGYGSTVLDAQTRGAAAIVVVTEGPTGEIVALNAHLERYAWRVPVILVAGREAGRLTEASKAGTSATVVNMGRVMARARANNVLAKRPAGRGAPAGAIVLTTPKSGWFSCAGERGSGMALFLSLADVLIRATNRELILAATSGHELEGLGGEALLESHAPPPDEIKLWVHVGANIASNVVDFTNAVRRTDAIHPQRGILVPAANMAAARAAFAGQPGYREPVDIMSDKAVGEVVIYRRDGYHELVGLVGGHPLHHTRLDTPEVATSPAALEPVSRALNQFVASII